MGQDPREVGAQRVGDDQAKSPEQLRTEIEDVREDLGDTVEALAAKTDVKTRARERADELKRSALAKKDELVAKAKHTTPAGGDGTGAAASPASAAETPGGAHAQGAAVGPIVEQVRAKAQENPVPTAALAAFVGGVAVGRLMRRR